MMWQSASITGIFAPPSRDCAVRRHTLHVAFSPVLGQLRLENPMDLRVLALVLNLDAALFFTDVRKDARARAAAGAVGAEADAGQVPSLGRTRVEMLVV